MPRIKASPKKCVKTVNSSQSSNTWVFLLKGEALENSDGAGQGGATTDVVQLRHPQTGAGSSFLFSPGDGMVQEVLTFSENKRDLQNSLGDEELNAYKYNEEKTLAWLQRKTERVADILRQKGIHVGGGAMSASFLKTTKQQSDIDSNESYLKYAHGIVSEYLADDLSGKLLKFMGLSGSIQAPSPPVSSSPGMDSGGSGGGKRKAPPSHHHSPSPHLGSLIPPHTLLPTHQDKKLRQDSAEAESSHDDHFKNGVLDLTKPEKELVRHFRISSYLIFSLLLKVVSISIDFVSVLDYFIVGIIVPMSWFIEDNVKSEGKMHLSTPIDPIFLVLPYLRKATKANPLSAKEKSRAKSAAGSKNIASFFKKK
ncbi:hypothetical protein J437_LFUL010835 [Ladona fulva]|uniref:Ribonuclease H2 subunit B wHTH domain-containing protein n=1 Tax=Ladona fulva TaxID=123851 RepID=A0A8K0K9P8_LADFU|nr:hypothetical protein J437_LFUL010835 [Ladona fulva]